MIVDEVGYYTCCVRASATREAGGDGVFFFFFWAWRWGVSWRGPLTGWMDGVVVLIWCLMMLVSVIDYAANYEPPWKIRGCFFLRRPEDPLAPLVHPPHVGRLHRTCTDFAAVFFFFLALDRARARNCTRDTHGWVYAPCSIHPKYKHKFVSKYKLLSSIRILSILSIISYLIFFFYFYPQQFLINNGH